MQKVALEGLEFFAYHGFYEEERKIGNRYGLDIEVDCDFLAGATADELSGTVNYETLYRIAREEMEQPSKLLEHVAHRILTRIKKSFTGIGQVKVVIRKFNPPLGGVCHASVITLCL